MTTQTPITAQEVFDGHDFRTNEGREGTQYYFPRHLTADQARRRFTEPQRRSGSLC